MITARSREGWETYRTVDPVGLLRMRVSVQRDRPSAQDGDQQAGSSTTVDIGWQSKIFSPEDVRKFKEHTSISNNPTTSKKYEQEIATLLEENPEYNGSSISTMVNEDKYFDPSEISYPLDKPHDTTELAEIVLEGAGERSVVEALHSTAQSMHIFYSYYGNDGSFHKELLAIVRSYPGGRIESRPPFSNKCSNSTAYKFFTTSQELCVYTIDVLEDIEEGDTEFEKELMREINKRRAIMESAIGRSALSTPPDPPGSIRMFFNGEISKAEFSNVDEIAIEYWVKLPESWLNEDDASILTGASQVARANSDGSFHINLPLEFTLICNSQLSPVLYIMVYRFSSLGVQIVEGYGSTPLPLTKGIHTLSVETWRVLGSVSQELESMFLENGLEIQSYRELEADIEKRGLNRIGLRTVGTGTVEIRLNVALQSSLFAKKRTAARSQTSRASNISALRSQISSRWASTMARWNDTLPKE